MLRIGFLCYVAFCIVALSDFTAEATQTVYKFDLVVYGATPAGIAGAIAAASTDASLSVALIEELSLVGGMSSPGGIGLRDFSTSKIINSTAREWAMLNAAAYGVSYPVWQPDNHVGQDSFRKLLSQYPQVHVFTNHRFASAETRNRRIVSLSTLYTPTNLTSTWSASTFIDASYGGDLLMASGATFTYGRESRAQYNESLAGVTHSSDGNFNVPVDAVFANGTLLPFVIDSPLLPEGSADDNVMGFSYRVCITTNRSNQAPFFEPTGYNREHFELYRRYLVAQVAAGQKPRLPFSALSYRSYPPGDKYDVCDDGTVTGITTDAANLNRGYVTGNYATRQRIAADHKYYVAGLFWFILTDSDVPVSLREEIQRYGLCADEWTDNGHWPPLLYVREGARMVGDRVFTQQDRDANSKSGCVPDSVALGDWGFDIHIMQRLAMKHSNHTVLAYDEGQTAPGLGGQGVFQIPFSILLPKRADVLNLLVPVCSSVTHVAFAAIREEPTLWMLGQAAGTAAALAAARALAVQDVPVGDVQTALTEQGMFFHWPLQTHCTVVQV